MTKKPPEKGLSESEVEYRHDEGLTDAEWDAWFERNKEALQQSFRKAREEYERGEYYTLEEAMAELEERAKRRQKRKG